MTGPTPRRLLADAGLHATRQRTVVLQLLTGRERPVSAQQLHADLCETGNRVGLTTVYRALQALTAAGLLHVFDRDGETVYRFCSPDLHHHLICRVCGLMAEGPAIPSLENWLAQVSAEHDFTPERHRVEVRGVCGACTPKPGSTPPRDPLSSP